MWIRLSKIQLFGYHGVHAHEREFGNKFEIDVELEADLGGAAKSDLLKETIDYAAVQKLVVEFSQSHRYNLLEAWAYRLALEIMSSFQSLSECVVRIRKGGGAVGGILEGVEVEYRHRRSSP